MATKEILFFFVVDLVFTLVAAGLALFYCFGFFLFGSGIGFIRTDGSHPFIGREPIRLVHLIAGTLIQGILWYGLLAAINFAVKVS